MKECKSLNDVIRSGNSGEKLVFLVWSTNGV